MGKVRVAIAGVGNCANSFVQGLNYYGTHPEADGSITPVIGGYTAADVEVVAAFDVVEGKVGKCLVDAIWAAPNDTIHFQPDWPSADGPIVQRGETLDGLGRYIREVVKESSETPCDVAQALKDSGATVLVNYMPVGSELAARYYAEAALKAGCAFVNCMPAFIASTPEWEERFIAAGLPIIGDDIKSQVGATIVHRVLANLLHARGVRLKRTSQLNVGGNSDFLNMLERDRLQSKKISKTQAVTSAVGGAPLPARDVHVGPSDYVPWLTDRKWAHIRLEGEAFGGVPLNIELKLEVWDSPNSAGVVLDAVRCAQLGLDKGLKGALTVPCAAYMKSPPTQMDDGEVAALMQDYAGKAWE
jgi:myo-inositol-1-phosphate synthase